MKQNISLSSMTGEPRRGDWRVNSTREYNDEAEDANKTENEDEDEDDNDSRLRSSFVIPCTSSVGANDDRRPTVGHFRQR